MGIKGVYIHWYYIYTPVYIMYDLYGDIQHSVLPLVKSIKINQNQHYSMKL